MSTEQQFEILKDRGALQTWMNECYVGHLPHADFSGRIEELARTAKRMSETDRGYFRALNLSESSRAGSPFFLHDAAWDRVTRILERGEKTPFGQVLRALELDSDPTLRWKIQTHARVPRVEQI